MKLSHKTITTLMWIIAIAASTSLTALSQALAPEQDSKDGKPDSEYFIDDMITFGKKLLGKPYRYKGKLPYRLDCSGFVCYLYSQYGYQLPRTSASMRQYTTPTSEPKPGDLLFFKGRNSRSSRVRHVALVVNVQEHGITMMHSTTSRGVIVERLNQSHYFKKRYLGAGRIPEVATIIDPPKTKELEPVLVSDSLLMQYLQPLAPDILNNAINCTERQIH